MKGLLFIVLIFLLVSCPTPHSMTVKELGSAHLTFAYSLDTAVCNLAKKYCVENRFNTNVALLSDMSRRSGRKRLFVVDLDKATIIEAGLVSHGHCQSYTSIEPQFSNEVGSNCTSLGRYKVGNKYEGRFGKSYKLHGMDETNSNAFDRFVVLHSHSCVPDKETAVGICRSEGCPTVSPEFLEKLETYIDNSNKPVLLWVYSNN